MNVMNVIHAYGPLTEQVGNMSSVHEAGPTMRQINEELSAIVSNLIRAAHKVTRQTEAGHFTADARDLEELKAALAKAVA